MARKSDSPPPFRRTYLKEWREKRGYTQAQVVARLEFMGGKLPTTGASLSRLENARQPYSQEILEALAEIYDTDPENLIGRNPNMDGKVIDFVAKLDEQQQRQLMAIAKAMAEVEQAR